MSGTPGTPGTPRPPGAKYTKCKYQAIHCLFIIYLVDHRSFDKKIRLEYQDHVSLEAAEKEGSEETIQVEEAPCRKNPDVSLPEAQSSSNLPTEVLTASGGGNVGKDERQTNLHIGKLLPSRPLS